MNWDRAVTAALGGIVALFLYSLTVLVVGSGEHRLDLIIGSVGTIVGGLSLAFGAYFALLAIDAFAHLRVIRDAEASANTTLAEVQKKHRAYEEMQEEIVRLSRSINDAGDRMFTALSQLVSAMPKGMKLEQRERRQKLADSLILERARFLLLNPGQPEDVLRAQMLHLASNGSAEDAQILDAIAKDQSKGLDIRTHAKVLAVSLRKA